MRAKETESIMMMVILSCFWVLGFMKSGKVRIASSALNYQVCGRRARMGPLQSGEEMGMLLLPDGITSLLDICATLT